MTATYHAEVIGSLLRPHYLSSAREALETGAMQPREFKRIEDSAVDEGIALQQGCGLDAITDGELRRFSFLDQLLAEVEGVSEQEGAAVTFHGRGGETWDWHPNITVTGKFRGTRMLTLEEFIYARARARTPVKVTLPSPLVLYGAWSPELSTAAYKDAFELFADAADVIRAEIHALARLGCTYVQIDSPDLGTLVDPENRALRESLGMPTERTLTEGVDIINSVCDVPGVTFGLHLCKGNYQSKWIASGGYDDTAAAIFGRMRDVDVFLLEYDDERSGSFEPLQHLPDDKVVVLGLVSSKTTEIEPVSEIVARVNEAAKYVDLERLGLSTQCGFASVSIGANLINAGTQQSKLELVGEAARQIWSLSRYGARFYLRANALLEGCQQAQCSRAFDGLGAPVRTELGVHVAHEAAATGVTYVDTYTATIGHDVCQPEDQVCGRAAARITDRTRSSERPGSPRHGSPGSPSARLASRCDVSSAPLGSLVAGFPFSQLSRATICSFGGYHPRNYISRRTGPGRRREVGSDGVQRDVALAGDLCQGQVRWQVPQNPHLRWW